MTDTSTPAAEAVVEETPAAETEAAETATDQTGEDAPAATDEGEGEQPKPKKSAAERIAEITAARREAEREAEYWKARATQAQAPTPPKEAQPKAEDSEPDPADYTYGDTDAAYIRDSATYHATKAARAEFQREAQQRQAQSAAQDFERRVATTFPDGEPVGVKTLRQIAQTQGIPEAIGVVITNSEAGPQLANHLGANPVELDRISRLSPAMQAYEMAKIEARITAPKAKTTTTAPDPAPQVRGAGGQFKVAPDTDDFEAFDKAY
jgi:hypothetical protein